MYGLLMWQIILSPPGGVRWKWLQGLRLCSFRDPRCSRSRHWENERHASKWPQGVSVWPSFFPRLHCRKKSIGFILNVGCWVLFWLHTVFCWLNWHLVFFFGYYFCVWMKWLTHSFLTSSSSKVTCMLQDNPLKSLHLHFLLLYLTPCWFAIVVFEVVCVGVLPRLFVLVKWWIGCRNAILDGGKGEVFIVRYTRSFASPQHSFVLWDCVPPSLFIQRNRN